MSKDKKKADKQPEAKQDRPSAESPLAANGKPSAAPQPPAEKSVGNDGNGGDGENGANGENGTGGESSENGENGTGGENGANGENGTGGENGANGIDDERGNKGKRRGRRTFLRVLDVIERVGNKLPHPATIFAILAAVVVVCSWIAHVSGMSAEHPSTGEKIKVFSLLSDAGFRYMFVSVIDNFVRFPPFGLVLVAMVGIGVAEGSGLIEAMLKHVVLRAPKRIITAVVVATGILSHLGSSVGYVVLIPLGAMVFLAFGRHPVAGIAAAFVGVSGGFGANFFIGSVDPILAGLSESAAQIIAPGISVNPAVNFYFMLASAFMVVIVGTIVTEKIVEPRLGPYTEHTDVVHELSAREVRGVRYAFVSFVVVALLFLFLVLPENGLLHGQAPLLERPFALLLEKMGVSVEVPSGEASVLRGPFFKGIITAMLIIFLIPGLVYGLYVGSIKNDRDFMGKVIQSMRGLAPYIVLVFFASQFVFYFKKSNLGIILAIQGAELIKAVGVSGVSLMIIFVLFSASMNMFMGSASAKWAIMAPVFVPMFMLSGYHPALTQAAFRIGDSVTNIITPMMSYFALIITFIEKYDKKAGIGTLIATMLPYTIVLTIVWAALLAVWYIFGLPLGPGGPLHY